MNWKFIVGLILAIFGFMGSFGRLLSGDIETSSRVISSGSFWFMIVVGITGGVLLILSIPKKR